MATLLVLLGLRRGTYGRNYRARAGGVLVELVALALILYGVVSIPWLAIPAVLLFVVVGVAARQR